MQLIRSLFFAAAVLTPAVANAEPVQPAPLSSEIRLSDEEKEKVLEAAAARKREHPTTISDVAALPPEIHGEVGFTIGTGGYRSIYGTAFTAIDDDGFAAMSFETTDFGKRDRYFDPWLR